MKGTVTRIIDGDTFCVNRKVDGTNKIRLENVNAPERSSIGGPKATNILRGLIGGQTVTINPVGRSYDRIVAKVSNERKSINKRMIEKGY
mgnify:CR=1 FL=1